METENIKPLSIVRPTAGRDSGALFAVLRVESGYAYLADGRGRRAEKPKKKKLKHLRPAEGHFAGAEDDEAAAFRETGAALTNAEIRKLLASFVSDVKTPDGGDVM